MEIRILLSQMSMQVSQVFTHRQDLKAINQVTFHGPFFLFYHPRTALSCSQYLWHFNLFKIFSLLSRIKCRRGWRLKLIFVADDDWITAWSNRAILWTVLQYNRLIDILKPAQFFTIELSTRFHLWFRVWPNTRFFNS